MKDAKAELVRIDSRGEAHPIGAVASQRMRAREGTYRVLPGPRHVVFMRYTGEDGRRDSADGAVVLLAGEIAGPGTMCDVLALLGQAGFRGELVVSAEEAVRCVFFDQGNVVGVQTNVDDERLGAVMYRYGVLSAEQVDRVMSEVVTKGKRFGEVAVDLGFVKHDQLYKAISKQLDEVVGNMLGVGDGTFFFLDGFDDSRLVSRHTVSANALLMDGVTRMDELSYFRQKIPASGYVPAQTEHRGAPAGEFEGVYAEVDGRRSIEELGRVTGLGEFETTKRVYALVQSGHVSMHPPRLSGGPAALVMAANSALRAIHRRARQGGKEQDLRDSLASFAVGAGVYEMLFRQAGPAEDGTFGADRVADNAVIVAPRSDPENILKQLLHEYVSFAVFSVGAALGSGAEAELSREVGSVLQSLLPQA